MTLLNYCMFVSCTGGSQQWDKNDGLGSGRLDSSDPTEFLPTSDSVPSISGDWGLETLVRIGESWVSRLLVVKLLFSLLSFVVQW